MNDHINRSLFHQKTQREYRATLSAKSDFLSVCGTVCRMKRICVVC